MRRIPKPENFCMQPSTRYRKGPIVKARTHVLLVAAVMAALGHVATATELGRIEITVAEMHCNGCAKKIAARLYTVPGVKSVSVDVKNKTLIVSSQNGKTLSPRQLCEAIENGDDRPVRLAGPNTMLVMEYPDDSAVSTKATQKQIEIVVEKMHCKACAQKIASKLYTVPGVQSVSVTVERKTLYVTPTPDRKLSLWALWEAVQQAENRALDIRGPTGSLKVAKLAGKQPTIPVR